MLFIYSGFSVNKILIETLLEFYCNSVLHLSVCLLGLFWFCVCMHVRVFIHIKCSDITLRVAMEMQTQ